MDWGTDAIWHEDELEENDMKMSWKGSVWGRDRICSI